MGLRAVRALKRDAMPRRGRGPFPAAQRHLQAAPAPPPHRRAAAGDAHTAELCMGTAVACVLQGADSLKEKIFCAIMRLALL